MPINWLKLEEILVMCYWVVPMDFCGRILRDALIGCYIFIAMPLLLHLWNWVGCTKFFLLIESKDSKRLSCYLKSLNSLVNHWTPWGVFVVYVVEESYEWFLMAKHSPASLISPFEHILVILSLNMLILNTSVSDLNFFW